MGKSRLKLRVIPEFFFCDSEQLSYIHLSSSVAIYDLKQTFGSNSIVFGRVVFLTLVRIHVTADVVKFRLARRALRLSIRIIRVLTRPRLL